MNLIGWDGLRAKGITLSETTIYRHMAAGKFPQARKQGEWKNAWVEQEIDDYIAGLPKVRGAWRNPHRTRHGRHGVA